MSVTIDSMNPQYAAPGATVTVAGTVSNRTGQTQTGLEVQLLTSPTKFLTRIGMDDYLAHGRDSSLQIAGTPFLIPASLPPGGTAYWTASFQVSTQGISAFGVYPVTAQLQDSAGVALSADQTLLPFWPGQQLAGLLRPLQISWLWPLIDQPHHQACAALTSNGLAAEPEPGRPPVCAAGRRGQPRRRRPDLGHRPGAAQRRRHHGPPLLRRLQAELHRRQEEPASQAAARWLAALKKVTPGQPTVITPYANVDMTALVHQGLTADLATAYDTGDAVAGQRAGRKVRA